MNTRPDSAGARHAFSARLGRKERIVFYGVAIGVFIGVPTILGVAFAIGFRTPWPLLFPVVFGTILALLLIFRTTGYELSDGEFVVHSPIWEKRYPLVELEEVTVDVPRLSGLPLGVVHGFYGTYGVFWSRKWGRFHVFVTDTSKAIFLRFGARRVIVSPDETERFLKTLAVEARKAVG